MSTNAPLRRSALDAVHARIGRGWPMSYGDPDRERAHVREALGIAEPGLYDKWLIRGRGALAACQAQGLDGLPGYVTPAAPGGINAWVIADDEVWLVAYAPTPGGRPIPAVDFQPLVGRITAAGAFATDVSSGWAVLRLAGPRARDLLAELVAEDLSAAAVANHEIRQLLIAGCRVVLARRDDGDVQGFTMLVARDDAQHLWESLLHVGEAYGITPVGAAALLPVARGQPVPPGQAVGAHQ